MSEKAKLTPELHKQFVLEYIKIRPVFVTYANVLKRVFSAARSISLHSAEVQSRAKDVSSFAEKCARKFEKYRDDPLNRMTDLCGARVIVQTQEQVEAVKQFIESNFKICERDEKGLLLGEEKFGYRDMHYLIQLKPERCAALGVTDDEKTLIGERVAELQVRTWLQHSWADTLHDRVYKSPLQLPMEAKRSGNLLAALMEEGDRHYDALVDTLDGMQANYASYASAEKVRDEMSVQALILENEPDAAKKPSLAMRLARLHAACGEYPRVVELLTPYENSKDADLRELSQDLGFAECKLHRTQPSCKEYEHGIKMLRRAVELYCTQDFNFIRDLHRDSVLRARATARLAWALEVRSDREKREALECWREAHDLAPSNPYILANLLGYLAYLEKNFTQAQTLRAHIREGIEICLSHAKLGTELPQAYFAAGKLAVLLNLENEGVSFYARGIHHFLDTNQCLPPETFEAEKVWISRLFILENPPPMLQWVLDLFDLTASLPKYQSIKPLMPPKALVVAGGAASITAKELAEIQPFIESILRGYKGRVCSGGTKIGVPECVGDVVKSLEKQGQSIKLIGYIPNKLPPDAPRDDRYEIVVCEESRFSPEQILRMWKDFKRDQIAPHEVVCVGFGGGPISAYEYRIALALGASVAVVQGSGGSADAIEKDELWKGLSHLLPVPLDSATFQFLLMPSPGDIQESSVEVMAQELHARYLADSAMRLPENFRPWSKLGDTYVRANREQARHAIAILRAVGFEVRKSDKPVIFQGFTEGPGGEVERMAELEHGRWNVDRLRDGWRFGLVKDEEKKLQPCLVPWEKLPDGEDGVRKYDRIAVRALPQILALAGLEVYRK